MIGREGHGVGGLGIAIFRLGKALDRLKLTSMANLDLMNHRVLHVKQLHELAEWFGFETRNKFGIQDERGVAIAYAAEQGHGFLQQIVRQFLGHWRTFEILFFTITREPIMRAHHPFRFLFQRLEIHQEQQFIGALQQRFSLFYKRFDVEGPQGNVLMTVASPIWRIWTFPVLKMGRPVAVITKKWTGILAEAFTDKDNFVVEYTDPALANSERLLLMAAALFIDLQYFEHKANSN